MENYITKEAEQDEILIAIGIWLIIGLVIGLIVISFFENIGLLNVLIPIASTVSFALLGYEMDFIAVEKNKIVSVYNSITMEPLFNAKGMRVWKMFGLRKISKKYDATYNPLELQLIKAITSDMVDVTVDVKIDYALIDPLKMEIEAGEDDVEKLLLNRARDYAEGSIKRETLDQLERNIDEGDIDKKLLESLERYFLSLGFTIKMVKMMNITTDKEFDEVRREKKQAEFKESARKYKNEQFRKRVQEYYLDSIIPFVPNCSFDELIDAASKLLNLEMNSKNELKIINEAVKIAEEKADIQKEKKLTLYQLKKVAKEEVETLEGIVPKQRFEGLGNGTKPWININK